MGWRCLCPWVCLPTNADWWTQLNCTQENPSLKEEKGHRRQVQLWRHLHMRGCHAVGSPACALVPLGKLAGTANSFLFAILHFLFKGCYGPCTKVRDCWHIQVFGPSSDTAESGYRLARGPRVEPRDGFRWWGWWDLQAELWRKFPTWNFREVVVILIQEKVDVRRTVLL